MKVQNSRNLCKNIVSIPYVHCTLAVAPILAYVEYIVAKLTTQLYNEVRHNYSD